MCVYVCVSIYASTSLNSAKVEQMLMGAKVHVCMCVCMSMRVSMCFDLWRQTSLGGTKVEQIWMAATVPVCLCVC